MTKSFKTKTLAAALAAVTLGTAMIATSNDAQARPRHGAALGIGLAVGALVGAAAVSHSYAGPTYAAPAYGYGYGCRWEERVNRWGYVRTVKVCYGY